MHDYVYRLEFDPDSQVESQIQQERVLENEENNQDAGEAGAATSAESNGKITEQEGRCAGAETQSTQEEEFQLGQQSKAYIQARLKAKKASDDAKTAWDKQKADDELGSFTLVGSNSALG